MFIPYVTTHDVQVAWNTPWNGKIALGVQNVANRGPVLDSLILGGKLNGLAEVLLGKLTGPKNPLVLAQIDLVGKLRDSSQYGPNERRSPAERAEIEAKLAELEQQGKTVEELDAQKDPDWWIKHQQLIPEMDARIADARTV